MFRLQVILDIRQGSKASLAVLETPIRALADVSVLVGFLEMVIEGLFSVEGLLARLGVFGGTLEVARSVGMLVIDV